LDRLDLIAQALYFLRCRSQSRLSRTQISSQYREKLRGEFMLLAHQLILRFSHL